VAARRAPARTKPRTPRPTRTRTPRPRTRRRLGRATYHHGDLRRALIDAAVAIIGDRGAEAFTLREAARRLGVNHRAAYRHFADKTSLLAAVAEQGFAALVELTRHEIAAAGPTDAEGRLLAMARAYVAWADRHPAHFRVMFGPRLNEDGPPAFEAPMAEAYQLLEAEIRAVIGAPPTVAGPGDDPVTDALVAYWSVVHGLASLVLMKRVRVRREQLPAWIDRIVGRALRGIRSRSDR
jgi:AcrR family transcriptional regulator